jgi:sodium-dependent dicarboxylate transporter 2/3/5
MIAIAIEKWNLHKRIALKIIAAIGTNLRSIILGFMVATGFLSMWISNTATAVMMLPIGMALVIQMQENPDCPASQTNMFGKVIMLGIAYSASIGGVATLIGTPPNLILAGVVQDLYGYEISFSQWMLFALPVSAVLMFLCWKYLVIYAFPLRRLEFPGGKEEIIRQLELLGPLSRQEKKILLVFLLTAIAWVTRSFLINPWLPAVDDTVIAMAGAIVMFCLPSGKGGMLLDWESAVKLPWGVLLLFGGGLALAEGFSSSGLADWIGSHLGLLKGAFLIVLLIVIVAAVNFLTELTSNLATTSMILPILAPMAVGIDVHPFALMVGATMAASCAFMLPVATPPNAVVFGSGRLHIPDMVRAGIWMNVISIIVVTIAVYLLLGLVWGINLGVFPQEF